MSVAYERMTETVKIVMPLPPKRLSQNNVFATRGGRMAMARDAKKYRLRAKVETLAQGVTTGPWEESTVEATFFHKINRRRDEWNYAAQLKPAIDGVVDARLLVDDDYKHLHCLPIRFEIDRNNPRVELVFTRKD